MLSLALFHTDKYYIYSCCDVCDQMPRNLFYVHYQIIHRTTPSTWRTWFDWLLAFDEGENGRGRRPSGGGGGEET